MKHFKNFALTVLVALVSCITASAENYILYTSSDGEIVTPGNSDPSCFGANIVSNTYEDGQGKIVFDGEVTSIGESAFYGCSSLTSVEIGNSVTLIGVEAFKNCKSLISVEFGSSVTEIGSRAFSNCSSLTSVKLPNSVTTIGDMVFLSCSALAAVEIGNSVKTIGNSAFSNCRKLSSVNITDLGAWCEINFGDGNSNPLRFAHNLYLNGDLVTHLVIPNSVTSIRNYAFQNCTNLTSVEIPNSVISIGNYAFYDCTDLPSVEIPNSVISIGRYAFYSCNNLTSVEIPNSVSSIGSYAFYSCNNLTSVKIPNSVTKIEERTFFDCSNLKSVEIPNSVTSIGESAFSNCSGLESVEIGNSVTEIGKNAFYGCYCLESVEIGNSVTLIAESTFYGCSNLTSVNIPNSVTGIGKYAFQSCSSLESVVIGESVTSIGNYAFAGCASLNGIVSLNTTPPNVDEYTTFSSEIQSSCIVLVPESAVDAYREAKGWKDFANIAAFSTDLIDGVEYTYNFDLKNCDVTYSRTFAKDNWQALFLPFAMQYNDWNDKGTVAELTGVSDGVLEWTILEEGSATVAGKPYIFKPNATGGMKFSVEGTTLFSNKTIVPVEISGYELSGTYTEKADMAAIQGYALSSGNFYCTMNETKKLKPYRIFLTVLSPGFEPIRSRINGEEATVIDNLITAPSKGEDAHYNLCGQKVSEGYNGIVIVNGRKVTRK